MSNKKLNSEKIIALFQTLVSVFLLTLILSSGQKNEDEKDTIPLYIFDSTAVSNGSPIPFTKPIPKDVSQNQIKIKNKIDKLLKIANKNNEVSDTPQQQTNSNTATELNEKSSPENPVGKAVDVKAYPSGRSFSTFYSKADYHYEEASKLAKKPKILSKGEFIYPEKAWDRDIEGTFKARLWVNTEGKVIKVDVLDVDNTFGFETAIKTMAMNFKYEPVIVKGQPVPFTIIVPFEFNLN